MRDHVIPHLGQVRLRELAPEHVRSWQAVLLRTPRRFRDGPLSTTTVRYCHRLLRRALQDALRWELVDRNVCDAVVAPRRADTEMSVWSPPDVPRATPSSPSMHPARILLADGGRLERLSLADPRAVVVHQGGAKAAW